MSQETACACFKHETVSEHANFVDIRPGIFVVQGKDDCLERSEIFQRELRIHHVLVMSDYLQLWILLHDNLCSYKRLGLTYVFVPKVELSVEVCHFYCVEIDLK